MKTILILSAILTVSIILMDFSSNASEVNVNTMKEQGTIARIWHGYTLKENANRFEKILTEEAIPSIEKNKPKGLKGIQLLRSESASEVEFTTIMIFDSIESVKQFAGEDYEAAHIDPNVKPLLLRYDARSQHKLVKFARQWSL